MLTDTPMRALSVWGVALGLLVACRTGRDEASGPDVNRTNATPVALDNIADDRVDVPEGDATDWKYLDLEQPGQLTIQLGWDSPNANLQMELYDALGQQLKAGEPFGQKGLQIVYAPAPKARYYLRVAAIGDDQSSSYSVKASWARVQPQKCHNCTPGQQICLGKDGYAVCEATPEGCNAWVQTFACEKDQMCKDGKCVAGCEDQCKADERRCASDGGFQVCVRNSSGCLVWGDVTACERGHQCKNGRCGRGAPPPPPKTSNESQYVKGKIISIYSNQGQRMLHIEIGEASPVQPGMVGTVLEGDSDAPLSGGELKVTKVTGNFCIATTSIEKLGSNRTVQIKVR